MSIGVLGPLLVSGSEGLNRRDRVVLETLATRPGHPVDVDQLVDALWGDAPPASAAKNLQGCIVRLRKALGRDTIVTTAHGYLLTVSPDQLDVVQFERLVARARELLTLGEADRAAYQVTTALSLWRGDPFPDLGDWGPAEAEARRLGELLLEAEELRVEANLRAGRHREVLAEARAMVNAAPLREQRWTLLAQAQYQAGQQGESLRTIHQLRAVLVQQLGIDPGPAVAALEGAILRQDASLTTTGDLTPSSRASCPYQGLLPYDVQDADRFFGRQDDVEACLEILGRTTLLALVGPSGSGKSSLLHAGITAALRSRGRAAVTITPGNRPMQALTALDQARRDAVLVVDQCEETFTLCHDTDERQQFLDALRDAAAARTVLIALRADRLADLTAHSSFSRLVEQGLYLVGGLGEEGLRVAVELPARQGGLIVEPGLVDVLVREVRDDPGALPLLSHALLETWKRREGNTLTVAGYRASGGIHGAVAQSAERLYAQLDPDSRPLLRDLVLRLVSPGVRGDPVRSRVPRRLLVADDGYDVLIERLVAARLVTSDDGVLEISHEALARAWPRLRGWLDDDIEGQRMLHHLAPAADAWDSLGRPDSELYRGIRLARTLDWQSRTRTGLTETERDFLLAARRHAEAEEKTAIEHARRQARLIRRLRGALVVGVGVLAIALGAGAAALHQKQVADDNAMAAADAAAAAVARGAGATAQVTGDIDESLLLGVAAARIDDAPQTRFSVLAAIQRYPRLFATTRMPGEGQVLAVTASPDGSTVATLDDLFTVRQFDAVSGEMIASHQAGRPRGPQLFDFQPPLAFSPDGRLLAVGTSPLRGAPVELLDARTLEPTSPQPTGLPRGRHLASDLSFSGDGRHLAAALQQYGRQDGTLTAVAGRVLTWNLRSAAPPRRERVRADTTWPTAALSHDGSLLYAGPPLRRVEVATGETVPLPAASDAANVQLSPDGRLLAAGGWDAALLDGRTGDRVRSLGGDAAYLSFSPDGRTLATISWTDRTITVWDVHRPRPVVQQQFVIGRGAHAAVDYSADGSFLYAAEGKAALRRWDLTGTRQLLARVPIPGLRPGGTGFAVVAPGGENSVHLGPRGFVFRDLGTGHATRWIPWTDGYRHTYGAWHPDGRHFVSAIGGVLEVWDIETGQRRDRQRLSEEQVTEIDYTPDGSRLVVSERGGRIYMLDGESLQPVGAPVELGRPALFVSASPDNHTAAVLTGGPAADQFWRSESSEWALVDLETGREIDRGPVGFDAGTWLAFSPDGRHFAVSGGDDAESRQPSGSKGMLVVYDTRTHRPVRAARSGHAGTAYHLAYSPDGSRILTSSLDGTVALWDALTSRLLARVNVEGRPHVSAEFLGDGTSARILEWASGRAFTWNFDPELAIDRACSMVGRNFTGAEWMVHFGDRPYQEVCDT